MNGPVIIQQTVGESFDDPCSQVVAGRRLPTLSDLLRGAPFFEDELLQDARVFAEGVLARIGEFEDGQSGLVFALARLTFAPSVDDFVAAAAEFDRVAACRLVAPDPDGARCHFYASVSGRLASTYKVAAAAVSLAYARDLLAGDIRGQCRGAVGWLLVSTGKLILPATWKRQSAADFVNGIDAAPGQGMSMVNRVIESRANILALPIGSDTEPTAALSTAWVGSSIRGLARPGETMSQAIKPTGTPVSRRHTHAFHVISKDSERIIH